MYREDEETEDNRDKRRITKGIKSEMGQPK